MLDSMGQGSETRAEDAAVPASVRRDLPLVYACSGCSSAAQLANHLAVRLDRADEAEMSCIAGVGGGVKPLVQMARRAQDRGRPILAIDGCALRCVGHSLARIGVEPTRHLLLSDAGVRKLAHSDFDPQQARQLLLQCTALVRELARQAAAPARGAERGQPRIDMPATTAHRDAA